MKKPSSVLATQSLLMLPIVSLIFNHQASVASSPVDRAIDDVDATELAVTTAGQKFAPNTRMLPALSAPILNSYCRFRKASQ
jgi:hypothetical protein